MCKKLTATRVIDSVITSFVDVGDHSIREADDGTDGYCYTHGKFDCDLTDAEVDAISHAITVSDLPF